jgi:hypothetical protein
VSDQRSKDMATRTERMTAKQVGRNRRGVTVRAFAVDVRRHGLRGGEREGHIHAARAINR